LAADFFAGTAFFAGLGEGLPLTGAFFAARFAAGLASAFFVAGFFAGTDLFAEALLFFSGAATFFVGAALAAADPDFAAGFA
jgi:hypothetical protein